VRLFSGRWELRRFRFTHHGLSRGLEARRRGNPHRPNFRGNLFQARFPVPVLRFWRYGPAPGAGEASESPDPPNGAEWSCAQPRA